MFVFTLSDIDNYKLNDVSFECKPSKIEVGDLLWGVDTKMQSREFNILMMASGEDVYFSSEDEDGDGECETVIASLKYFQ